MKQCVWFGNLLNVVKRTSICRREQADSSCCDCLRRIKREEDPNIQPKTNFTAVRSHQFCALKSMSSLLPWLRQKLPPKAQHLQENLGALPVQMVMSLCFSYHTTLH
ncbi:hypothetical protein AMECASPLE_014188 [Ameca splendens]|uniref:Uncharacterized protein n=1 Tax=Ameca splendens TaxID=208324 RepID=A0ABV1A899_9TELE